MRCIGNCDGCSRKEVKSPSNSVSSRRRIAMRSRLDWGCETGSEASRTRAVASLRVILSACSPCSSSSRLLGGSEPSRRIRTRVESVSVGGGGGAEGRASDMGHQLLKAATRTITPPPEDSFQLAFFLPPARTLSVKLVPNGSLRTRAPQAPVSEIHRDLPASMHISLHPRRPGQANVESRWNAC